jgi:hypothetical protein
MGMAEVSYNSLLRDSESGGTSEGLCFSGAPLGLPTLLGHDGRNKGMEGVRGHNGGMLVVNLGQEDAQGASSDARKSVRVEELYGVRTPVEKQIELHVGAIFNVVRIHRDLSHHH